MTGLFSEISESKREIKKRLEQEGDTWNHDNLTLKQYNSYFKPYIGSTIDEIAAAMRSTKRKLIVVNLMGGTRVLRDLGVEESYAVRLTDGRNPNIKAEDEKKNITLISGDILSKNTINKLPMEIDILLCMPEGAAEFIPSSPDLFYYFGESLLRKMSVGGIAMIQLPLFTNQWMVDYARYIDKSNGVTLTHYPLDKKGAQSVLVLRKLNSKAHLPIMLYQ